MPLRKKKRMLVLNEVGDDRRCNCTTGGTTVRRTICATADACGVSVGDGDQEHIIQLGQCVS